MSFSSTRNEIRLLFDVNSFMDELSSSPRCRVICSFSSLSSLLKSLWLYRVLVRQVVVAVLAPHYRVQRDSLVKISDTPDLTVHTP